MFSISDELYRTQQVQRIESMVIEQGLFTEQELMEKAGSAALNALIVEWPEAKKITVFCGRGNNSGDGFVLARLARQEGMDVTVYMVEDITATKGAAREAALACQDIGLRLKPFSAAVTVDADVVVDALLGTGLKGDVKGIYELAINAINASHCPVLAMDVPSGIDANSGGVHRIAVKADITVTFVSLKQGLFTFRAPAYCGKILCHALDIPDSIFQQLTPSAELLSWKKVKLWLPKRERDTHKGDYGHVLVIGGDYGMGGAIRMAAEAALRTGAGLVTVATRPEHVAIVNTARPEIMCHEVFKGEDLEPLLERATVVVIGPGLGKTKWAQSLLATVLDSDLPKVLDADSLNLLSKNPRKLGVSVLTHHPGEAATLLQTTTEKIQSDRFKSVNKIQESYGGVVVLKGAGTLIKGDSPVPAVCRAGNPGMATGGMGDILSGVIGALIAQGLDIFAAAEVGVFVHALAADRAAAEGGERGLLPTDLLDHLRRLVNPVIF